MTTSASLISKPSLLFKQRRLFYAAFFSILMCNSAYAQIYQWTDKQGVVHFSDMAPSSSAKVWPDKNNKFAEKIGHYESLQITRPNSQETIRNNKGEVVISVQIRPSLLQEHQLQLVLDGKPYGKQQRQLFFYLSGLDRGTHRLLIQVVNLQKEVIQQSKPITIYLFRPRVGMIKKGSP